METKQGSLRVIFTHSSEEEGSHGDDNDVNVSVEEENILYDEPTTMNNSSDTSRKDVSPRVTYQSVELESNNNSNRRNIMHNKDNNTDTINDTGGKSTMDILHTNGVLEKSLREMYVRLSTTSSISNTFEHIAHADDNDLDHEILILHEIYYNFSYPRPTYDQIEFILQHYRRQQQQRLLVGPVTSFDSIKQGTITLSLPTPSVIMINDKHPCYVVRLLTMNVNSCLLCLPLSFQLSFFHILIRLLTSEDAIQYNTYSTRDMHLPSHPEDLPTYQTPSNDIIYSLARFCAKPDWKSISTSTGGVCTPLLHLLTIILSSSPTHHLIVPISRLLGLTAAISISVEEFRLILDLIAYKSHPNIAKLYLIRALSTASNTPPITTPRCFFNFSPPPLTKPTTSTSSGIQLSLPYWPFKSDFALIVSFRAETFASCNDHSHTTSPSPSLFKIITDDGTGIEIKFETDFERIGAATSPAAASTTTRSNSIPPNIW